MIMYIYWNNKIIASILLIFIFISCFILFIYGSLNVYRSGDSNLDQELESAEICIFLNAIMEATTQFVDA